VGGVRGGKRGGREGEVVRGGGRVRAPKNHLMKNMEMTKPQELIWNEEKTT
jgi:hypothetical protein